jgi:hypothetical protein
MNATEAYRHVLNAAIALHQVRTVQPRWMIGVCTQKQLVTAIRKITPRVQRMEARLNKARAKRRTSTNRPKCLQ